MTIVNAYFLSIIALNAEFRNRETYPVALQAVMDLMFVGVASIAEAIGEYRYSTTDTGATAYWQSGLFHCICTLSFSHMNEIATPMTMIALSVQRFFHVCYPFIANGRRFSRHVFRGNVIITILPFLLIIPSVARVIYLQVFHPNTFFMRNVCYSGIFWSDSLRVLIGGAIFFILPVTFCAVLYFFVGRRLFQMTTMQTRNRQLTILFMVSCLLWVVLWLPEKIMVYYYQNLDNMNDLLGKSQAFHFFFNRQDFFTRIFSITQPLILVFCYRPLHQPILSFFKKLREKCGCGGSG